jgi:hypothetical protein
MVPGAKNALEFLLVIMQISPRLDAEVATGMWPALILLQLSGRTVALGIFACNGIQANVVGDNSCNKDFACFGIVANIVGDNSW